MDSGPLSASPDERELARRASDRRGCQGRGRRSVRACLTGASASRPTGVAPRLVDCASMSTTRTSCRQRGVRQLNEQLGARACGGVGVDRRLRVRRRGLRATAHPPAPRSTAMHAVRLVVARRACRPDGDDEVVRHRIASRSSQARRGGRVARSGPKTARALTEGRVPQSAYEASCARGPREDIIELGVAGRSWIS